MTDETKPASKDAVSSAPDETALTKALTANGLKEMVAPLAAAKYRTLESLGKTETEVKTNVAAAFAANKKDSKPLAGDLQELLRLWGQATSQTSVPDLKVGTKLDLTQTTQTVKGIDWQLPTLVKASKATGGTFKKASELDQGDWIAVAKRTRMLFGLDLEEALSNPDDDFPRDDFAVARYSALDWVVPERSFADTSPYADSLATWSCSAYTSALVSNRIMSGSLKGSYAFVGGAAEASRNEQRAQQETYKTVSVTARSYFRKAMIVDLRNCATASEQFRTAVDIALAENDSSQRLLKLSEVFRNFGHVVPVTIDIGAAYYFVWKTATKNVSTGEKVETVASAALSAKLKKGSVEAKATFADGTGKTFTADTMLKAIHCRAFGGNVDSLDDTGSIDVGSWMATKDDPNLWAVIDRRNFVSVTEFLPPQTQTRVKEAWDKAVSDAWGGHPPRNPGYALPDFHGSPPDVSSKPFTLSTSVGSERVLTPNILPGQVNDTSPFSKIMAAVDEGLTWKLAYTKRCTTDQLDGVPLYWILEHQSPAVSTRRLKDQQRVDAKNRAIDQMGGGASAHVPRPASQLALSAVSRGGSWYAGVMDAATVLAESPVGSPAVWSVAPADPSTVDPSKPNKYVIRNQKTGLVLGALATSRDLTPDGSEITAATLVQPPAADVDLTKGPTAWVVRLHR
jgi:hypothetical protein